MEELKAAAKRYSDANIRLHELEAKRELLKYNLVNLNSQIAIVEDQKIQAEEEMQKAALSIRDK